MDAAPVAVTLRESKFDCMMDADERDIFHYLRSEPDNFVPLNSISRHAGGKHKQQESPDWARPALGRMVDRGIVEADPTGAYRLKPVPTGDPHTRHWVSPQIAELLRKSGKKFDDVIQRDADPESYYDSL